MKENKLDNSIKNKLKFFKIKKKKNCKFQIKKILLKNTKQIYKEYNLFINKFNIKYKIMFLFI